MSWCILEVSGNGKTETKIRTPLKKAKKSGLFPPIPLTGYSCSDKTWIVFKDFLIHLISLPEDSWKTLCYYIRSALEAGVSIREIEALVLSVSIEGILGLEFSDFALSGKSFKEEVQLVKKYFSDSDLSVQLKNRLNGSLSAMLNSRAKDKLIGLKEQGGIDKELIKAWESFRHPFAHGVVPDYKDIQAYINCRGSIIVLFHQLIFLSIGYKGEYCDYSCPGYNIKIFDKVYKRDSNSV